MNKAYAVRKRRDAAEEVCWTLIIMMQIGMLQIPMEERKWISESFMKWADLAVETGIMNKE